MRKLSSARRLGLALAGVLLPGLGACRDRRSRRIPVRSA
jgi:hypothetical protein